MARRNQGHAAGNRRRRGPLLVALAAVGAAAWFAPEAVVRTPLRDRPLAAALAGIDGSIKSGGATWRWVGGLEFRDVVLRDRAGRPAVIVPRLIIDRGLARLAIDRRSLGTVRLVGPEALVEVRGDGSSLEDILAPWLAATGDVPALDVEVLDGTVEFVDSARRDAWRLSDVIAAGTLRDDGSLAGWTAAGRLRHSAGNGPSQMTPAASPPGDLPHLDRSTIPTAAAGVLVRDGGWSISSPAPTSATRTMTVAGHRVPLGFSSIIATRFGLPQLLDGIADIRLDVTDAVDGRRAQGVVTVERFALCDSADLAERLVLDRCEVPFDVGLTGDRLSVRRLTATSPMVRADVAGTLRLPQADIRGWVEQLAADDFTLSVDVDMAAAARGLPDGIRVRPDVRITGGALTLSAASRADGADRLLEVRATARDLAATAAPARATEPPRDLAWPEPFSGWLKARRPAAGSAGLRLEEARIVSSAGEVSATGAAGTVGLQWTADIGAVAAGLAEVFELGVSARGRTTGRIDLVAGGVNAPSAATIAASVEDLAVEAPGAPPWRDERITIDGEAAGAVTGSLAAIDQARALVVAGEDRMEASITGGVLVDLAAVCGLAADRGVPWIRPAAGAENVAADCRLSGDLAGWQPRLAAMVLGVGGLEAAGRLTAATTVSARGDAWHFDRAAVEVEKLSARWRGREIEEPRIVASASGRVEAASGRVVLASAELLSATLSLRSGGLTWDPVARGWWVDRIRGRMQWQADLSRLERWLLEPAAIGRWPLSGRGWGTCEIGETQSGLNVLFEATGSQIAVAGGSPGRPLWMEPRPALVVEVTRPFGADGRVGDALRIDRVAIESATVAASANGGVHDLASRRMVSLEGTAAYDWDQISRLLTPWTGGRVRFTGSGGRPFAIRGPLGPVAAMPIAAAPVAADAAAVPLPADWLSATRGGDAAGELTARLARPVSTAPAPTTAGGFRDVTLDTSAAWAAGDIDGIPLAAGEMAVRLLEGQLALGPFDIPAAGGRLRSAPWIRLEPLPGELIVPPGRVVERVALSGPWCDRWMKWLVPVLGHATHTSGVVTVDLAGARLPLSDASGGELAGQLLFENLEVTPAAGIQPLVNLIVKLQSVIDPRFAFGDKAVLLRVRPDPVRVRLAGRRFSHEGLVMDAGQLVVTSQGSVGHDGTLDMRLEVALRGDLIGTTPVLGQLFRTPLLVPLKGTVTKPQFDAAALDAILGRIVENTAEAVIKDGIGRGLEAVFGQPSPPIAPAPGPSLVLPPR